MPGDTWEQHDGRDSEGGKDREDEESTPVAEQAGQEHNDRGIQRELLVLVELRRVHATPTHSPLSTAPGASDPSTAERANAPVIASDEGAAIE